MPRKPAGRRHARLLRFIFRSHRLDQFVTKLIRLVPTKHVPNDRRQFSHHRNASRLRSLFAFDFLVPRLHFRVFAENVNHREIQNLSRDRTSCFRDASQPLFSCRVVTSRRQTEIIREASRCLEPFDITDSRQQRDRSHRADARYRFQLEHHFRIRFRVFGQFPFDFEDLFVEQFPRFEMHVDFDAVDDRQLNRRDPFSEFVRMIQLGRRVLSHIVFIDDAFDFVDDSRALSNQVLAKVGELPDLGIFGIGGKNASNAVGSLSALEPFAVVPEEFAECVGITFVGFFVRGMVGLNDDDFVAIDFFEFFEEPIVEAADFDDSHEAAMLSGFFSELLKKIVTSVMIGANLFFLNDISVFVSQIDCQLVLVLVDSEIQHLGLRRLKGFGCKQPL